MGRYRLEVGVESDVGRQRQRNEDSYAVYVPTPDQPNPSELVGLLLVADGMGGERAGDRASQTAAARMREWLVSGAYREWPEAGALETVLGRAIRDVSDEIYQLGEEDPEIRGLGSTLVVAAITDGRAVVAHVGDSRCYRVRHGQIERLTSDHSWVERQVEAGVLTPDQARQHPQRNVLTRSLGDEESPEVDLRAEGLRDGDVFILCTDGLTGKVTDDEILDHALVTSGPQALAEALVELANEVDGSDNVTVVVGRCIDQELPSSESELDETLPLARPHIVLPQARPRRRTWLPLLVGFVLGSLVSWAGLRLYGHLALEKSMKHLESGEILHAQREIHRYLSVGLDDDQIRRLTEVINAQEGARETKAGSEEEQR